MAYKRSFLAPIKNATKLHYQWEYKDNATKLQALKSLKKAFSGNAGCVTDHRMRKCCHKGGCWFFVSSDFEHFLQILGAAECPEVALFEGACDRVAQLPA
jgi:hypothetical protein